MQATCVTAQMEKNACVQTNYAEEKSDVNALRVEHLNHCMNTPGVQRQCLHHIWHRTVPLDRTVFAVGCPEQAARYHTRSSCHMIQALYHLSVVRAKFVRRNSPIRMQKVLQLNVPDDALLLLLLLSPRCAK